VRGFWGLVDPTIVETGGCRVLPWGLYEKRTLGVLESEGHGMRKAHKPHIRRHHGLWLVSVSREYRTGVSASSFATACGYAQWLVRP
jgi:hypothetical protein